VTMPGFHAEKALAIGQHRFLPFDSPPSLATVTPAMTIEVDGVYYCEGQVTDEGVVCYGHSGPGGGGMGGGGKNTALMCRTNCRKRCGSGRASAACYSDCVADC